MDPQGKQNLLQSLLDEYSRDGEWESEGTFSIDNEKAVVALARYQSSDPDLFLLHFVRFAVLCGANHCSLELLPGNRLVMRHNGIWPELLKWHNLWGHESGPERALAFCLWNALRFRALECSFFRRENCLRLDRSLEEAVEKAPGVGDSLVFQLGPAEKLRPLGEDQRPMLTERCAFAPLTIRYLGTDLQLSPDVPCAMRGLFQGTDKHFPMLCPEGDADVQKVRVNSPYFAHVYVGVRDKRQGLCLLIDGVSYLAQVPWGLPRLFIVLAGEGLRLDLAGERPVRNEFHDSLHGWLVRDLDFFFRNIINDIDSAPAGMVPYLEALISVRLGAGDHTSAYEICRWVYLKITARKLETFNIWQRANFLYRYALISNIMKDREGARHLREQAEKAWKSAEPKDDRWLPRADVPEGKLSQQERADFCRLAVEEQTMVDGPERARAVLLKWVEDFHEARRWNLVAYCQRWLLRLEQSSKQNPGRKAIALRQALLGVALIRHLRDKSSPLNDDWYEAQVCLSQALLGWRSQLERQQAVEEEDRSVLLEILDALVHIHLALGQAEGARRMMEVFLDEQRSAPQLHLQECLGHLQRLKGMLTPQEVAIGAALDRRITRVKAALKEQKPGAVDSLLKFFRRQN